MVNFVHKYDFGISYITWKKWLKRKLFTYTWDKEISQVSVCTLLYEFFQRSTFNRQTQTELSGDDSCEKNDCGITYSVVYNVCEHLFLIFQLFNKISLFSIEIYFAACY